MWQRCITAVLKWLASLWKVDNVLSADEVVRLFQDNFDEINAIWTEMGNGGIDATMRDAVEEWLRRKGK